MTRRLAANVGLSSAISADRNISPPRQINLDIKVTTGAVITWCNLNPELFSSHPTRWIYTAAAARLFFLQSDEMYGVWRGERSDMIKWKQIWSNEKRCRSFGTMVSVSGLSLWSPFRINLPRPRGRSSSRLPEPLCFSTGNMRETRFLKRVSPGL